VDSSLLCPSRFAEAAVPHGTTAIVSDPHEIANVLGMPGISYMRRDAAGVPLRFYFTAPSCVPSTPFETAGAWRLRPRHPHFRAVPEHPPTGSRRCRNCSRRSIPAG
jgi:adenine deaminase